MSQVVITLTNGQSDYDLKFDLLPIAIAQKWLHHVRLFTAAGQPWDDDQRFYNFPHGRLGRIETAAKIRELAGIIKQYAPWTIQRSLQADLTQDDLNYLHHVFEQYHGLYDQQHNNEFFTHAPREVQDALGDLNIWIHRYETLGGIPRFVATWKYKPYRDVMTDEDLTHFSLHEQWGDLRLNYCEIGKTLYDLWHDNDQHIGQDAFVPQKHFCFDFTVRFSDADQQDIDALEQQIWQYFDQHRDFFHQSGYRRHDPALSLGGITIGKLDISAGKTEIFDAISRHQQMRHIRILGDSAGNML